MYRNLIILQLKKKKITIFFRAGIDEVHLPRGENNAHHICKSQKSSTKMSSNRISSHLEGSILGSAVQNIHRHYYTLQNSSEHLKNKGTQTDYRESECQTLPWEPPYKIRDGKYFSKKEIMQVSFNYARITFALITRAQSRGTGIDAIHLGPRTTAWHARNGNHQQDENQKGVGGNTSSNGYAR